MINPDAFSAARLRRDTLAALRAARAPTPDERPRVRRARDTAPAGFYGAINNRALPRARRARGAWSRPALAGSRWRTPISDEAPGTSSLDPDAGFLHLVEPEGRAMPQGAPHRVAPRGSGTGRAAPVRRQWPALEAARLHALARKPRARALTPSLPAGHGPRSWQPSVARRFYLFQGRRRHALSLCTAPASRNTLPAGRVLGLHPFFWIRRDRPHDRVPRRRHCESCCAGSGAAMQGACEPAPAAAPCGAAAAGPTFEAVDRGESRC